MSAIAPKLPSLIGGSADLDPSTHTALKDAAILNLRSEPRATLKARAAAAGITPAATCTSAFANTGWVRF